MNVKKSVQGFSRITGPTFITKSWRKISGYKTRGYALRVRKVNMSRTIMRNPEITWHVKRNRAYRLVKRSNRNKV